MAEAIILFQGVVAMLLVVSILGAMRWIELIPEMPSFAACMTMGCAFFGAGFALVLAGAP